MSNAAAVDNVHLPLSQPAVEYKRRTRLSHDFRRYEMTVMATTQLSYVPVTATMLCTAFFEPPAEYCELISTNSSTSAQKMLDFHSLLIDWGLHCQNSIIVTLMSMCLMAGALCGAFIAGWLADIYGRRPVVRACLLLIGLGNLAIALLSYFSSLLTAFIFFLLGTASGGYMVVNLVMFVECLELPRSRLLAVSTNGWSISMTVVAFMTWLSFHWTTYHLTVAGSAFIALFASNFLLVESCRWLDSVLRIHDAHRAAMTVASRNNYKVQSEWSWWQVLRFSSSAAHLRSEEASSRKYNYFDLFRSSRVYLPLLALAYCFIASSIVSFGFYFNLDVLPGNRFVNMAAMGASKFILGWIPFFLSPWMGRRPIVLCSIGVASAAAWSACFTIWLGAPSGHWIHAVLSLIISASLDPTWKINHLYSTELFPTAVRNMARGICNVGARFGSVIAPAVVHLRSVHHVIPLAVFTAILSLQFVVVALFLPETKDSPLPADFPPRKEDPIEMIEDPSKQHVKC